MSKLDAAIIACGGDSNERAEAEAFMRGIAFVHAQFLAAADVVRKNEKGNPKFAVNLCKLADVIFEAGKERARELYPDLPEAMPDRQPPKTLQE